MRRVVAWIVGTLSFWVGWIHLSAGYWLMSDPGDNPFRDPRDPATGIRWMVIGAALVVTPFVVASWTYLCGRRRAGSSAGNP
jgi:hypothetical protein